MIEEYRDIRYQSVVPATLEILQIIFCWSILYRKPQSNPTYKYSTVTCSKPSLLITSVYSALKHAAPDSASGGAHWDHRGETGCRSIHSYIHELTGKYMTTIKIMKIDMFFDR